MSQDEILWINNASYELRCAGLRIVHDPWLEGSAFQDAWSLLTPSKYRYEDFRGVDYLWLSHEHPDHFAPAVLRKIPDDVRARITVLHRHTRDKRVIGFCRKLGFAVQELPNRQPVALKNGVSITCGAAGDDSWCLIETPAGNYFNANDCVGVKWASVAAALAKRIDVLFTQFSYASWVGNPGETQRMAKQARHKIEQMEEQVAAFRPAVLIPFASYVWFCRHENFHLNSQANDVRSIYKLFCERLQTVVLYPGDVYRVGLPFDSSAALERYAGDAADHSEPLPSTEKTMTLEELQSIADEHQRNLRARNSMWLLRPLSWTSYVKPVNLYLKDLREGVRYSMFGGIVGRGIAREQCDLELSSASLANMLTNGYGFNTLYIGGRFIELTPGGCARLSKHFAIFGQNAVGYTFPRLLFRWDYVRAHLASLLAS